MNPVLLHAVRESRRRPSRPLLSLAGVVLGVAALVAVLVSTRGAQDAYRRVYRSLAGGADLEVVAEGGSTVEVSLAESVARVPGVSAALPVVSGSAALVAPGPRTPVHVLGVVPGADSALRPLEIVEGGPLSDAEGVLLPAAFARERGVGVGARVRLVTVSGPVELPIRGLLGPASLAAAGSATVLLPLGVAQRLFGTPGRASAIQAAVGDAAAVDEVSRGVAAILPPGLRVERPWARGALAEGTLAAVDAGLGAVSLMSLVAAVFVIGNAFAMGLLERRRSLAILRGIGASRRQVTFGLCAEAACLGLVGAAVGLALGVPLARGVAAGYEQMLGTPLPDFPVGWEPIVVALVAGPASTLAGAFAPIRRAGRRDLLPDLVLGSADPGDDTRPRGPWPWVGLLAVVVSVGVGVLGLGLPDPLVAPGVALAMFGGALAFPWALPLLRRALRSLASAWRGPSGWIGFQQVARRPAHATLTATVVFVAAMAGVGVGGRILSAVDDVRTWSARSFEDDWYVRATMPEAGTMLAATLPRSTRDDLRAIPGVTAVRPIRFVPVRSGKEMFLLVARGFDPDRSPSVVVRDVLGGGPLLGIGAGDVVLGVPLARRLGLRPGDRLEIDTPTGPKPLRVVATATEYTAGGHAALVSWDGAEALLGAGEPHALTVAAAREARGSVGTALRAFCEREGLLLQSNTDLATAVDRMVDGIMGLLWTALVLVFAVAAVGVANTVTTAVVDQTRSLGMLRAVGMTRGQVARSVAAQALALAILGAVPGVLAGHGLGWLLQQAIVKVHGYEFPFGWPTALLVACVVAAALVALLASAVPAFRASRISVPEALRTE